MDTHSAAALKIAKRCWVGLAFLALAGCAEPRSDVTTLEPADLDALTIRITGRDYAWHIRYPGADGVFHTGDDVLALRDVYLPAGSRVTVELVSEDYLYSYAIPSLRIKEIAVPDLVMTWEIPPRGPENLEVKGDQMCGYAHRDLMGKIVVQERSQFLAWLSEQKTLRE